MTFGLEECLEVGGLRELRKLTERADSARNAQALTRKRLAAARTLLGTEGEQFVVGHAAMAMEAKANELLAWHGYHAKNHVCTQVGLSRILGLKDHARRLSIAYNDRVAYDYTADPTTMSTADTLEGFIEAAEAYIEELEPRIEEAWTKATGGK